jgi:predicted DNA-binding ribbon-helix-helix protein
LGEHLREVRSLDASEGTAGISSALPDSQLFGYRVAVDDLVEEASRHLRPSDLFAAEGLIAKRLEQPEFTSVLSRLAGGVDVTVERLIHEIRNYRPSVRSSASDLPAFVRIFLLSQIDSVWWSGTAPFVSDADVLCSTELVDLRQLRSAKMLQFRYRAQAAGLSGRARDWAQRQVLPAIRPHTAGLRFTRSRPAVVAVVNQIARELAAALPPRTPRIWVNSMVRSVQHQHRLRSLGYAGSIRETS